MESKSPILRFWQKAWWSKLILVGLGFFIWPFVVGGGISYLLASKIKSSPLKWLLIFPVLGFSIFFGTAWVAAFILPSQPKKEVAVITSPTPLAQVISPLPSPTPEPTATLTVEVTSAPKETPTLTSEPTLSPSPSPKPSPTPTSTPTQAKQVSLSIFKKHFQDNFDYGQFTKAFTSSDNWDFWESDNLYGDKLILAAIGEDLKNGVLKTGPNETAAIQVVTFFLFGHPPLISSGWVENIASIIEKGKKEETTLQGTDASIMLSPDGVWIVSFTEK